MAGYIVALGLKNKSQNREKLHTQIKDVLTEIISTGVYSTNLNIKNSYWSIPNEGTFADYLSMREGDNIYFFIDRKIYGIGKLVNINGRCIHLNFPDADIPESDSYSNLKKHMILNKKENMQNRFLCTFEADPLFFKEGVDMDDVLSSNPEAFKMLRFFQQLSFIKIDDIENKALQDILLKKNEEQLSLKSNVFEVSKHIHSRIQQIATDDYIANAKNLLKLASNQGAIEHEMAIEAGIIDYIINNPNSIFGKWDYVSHQVAASPFKPVIYVDKMDVFGYKNIEGYQTISKYLMIEIKKDKADKEVIHQAMKYVDWINQEYSFGDYDMIQAYIVAKEFPEEVIQTRNEFAERAFIKGRRPPITSVWNNLKLIEYHFDDELEVLRFKEVEYK